MKLRDECGGTFKQEWVTVKVKSSKNKKEKVTVLALKCQKCKRITFTMLQAKRVSRKLLSMRRRE